jgi:hypothetical protein
MEKTVEKKKVKVEVELELDPEWIDYLLNWPDIFMRDYCGYWLRGVVHQKKKDSAYGRWLCWEEGEFADEECERGKEPGRKEAMLFFKARIGELPKHWFILDEETATKAWIEGVKRMGVGFANGDGDANDYDVAVQMALLGEVKYG